MACSEIGSRISNSGFQTWLHIEKSPSHLSSLTPDQLDQNLPVGHFWSSLHDSNVQPGLTSTDIESQCLCMIFKTWCCLARRPMSWQVAKPLSGSPREQWECCSCTLRREGLEHLWPMKEQPQPWLKECACCLFQLATWSISTTQSIMHVAKCYHRMATCDLKTLLSGHAWATRQKIACEHQRKNCLPLWFSKGSPCKTCPERSN